MAELTENQRKILEMLEKEGLADEERMHVLGEMVKGAAAWSVLKKWIIQVAAAIGALGVLGTAVFWLRDFLQSGGPR